MQSPVMPRLAASLIVLRHDEDQPRILMARRNAAHRFMPGVLVFPGGAVDAGDHHARAARPLRPHVVHRVERSGVPAQPLAMAAARELSEEVSLSLGSPPDLHPFEYLCRAITPPDRTIRFDAHFFLVDAAHVTGTARGSDELEEPGWYTLDEALSAKLALATEAVLGQLRHWLAHQDRDGLVPVLRDRQWVHE